MANPNDTVQAGLYQNGVGLVNDFTFQPGVCVLPVAQDPPTDENTLRTWSPVVILRLHAPYRLRKTTYREEKQNNPPVAPAPGDTGAFVFVGGQLSFSNQLNNTFCNFDWVVGSEYVYVENCVSRNQDGFVLGSVPWTWQMGVENNATTGITQPPVGAIAQAGLDPLVGYVQGQLAIDGQTGQLKGTWGYNTPSYYPGTLLSDDLANGGSPAVA